MAFFKATVTVRGVPKISRSQQRQIKTDAMRRIGFKWYAWNMKRHFTAAGAQRYQYRKRVTKDIRSGTVHKFKSGKPRAPDGRPLVWTGESMKRAKQKRVAATSKTCRVIMQVNAFNFRPKNSQINLSDEFRRVTASEVKELGRDSKAYIEKRYQNLNATVTVRIQS